MRAGGSVGFESDVTCSRRVNLVVSGGVVGVRAMRRMIILSLLINVTILIPVCASLLVDDVGIWREFTGP